MVPYDIKSVAVATLLHRLRLRPELWVRRIDAYDLVKDRLYSVPTPPARDGGRADGVTG